MEKYQTFGLRFVALIIDGLIFLPLLFVSYAVGSLNLNPVVSHLWILAATLASPFYMILMHGFYGQTLGKMLVKVKVVDLYENPITFHHAVLRSLPNIFFSLMLIFFSDKGVPYLMQNTASLITVLSFLWSIFDIIVFFVNDKHRALHDFIAGTVVVKLN